LENVLAELGCVSVAIARIAADALTLIAANAERLDAATLDVNLGTEKSDLVAADFQARGIPFVVITGYEDEALLAAFAGRPILNKPVKAEDLEQALQLWRAGDAVGLLTEGD
jgi:CheY-like chemotaxis protein